MDEVYCQKSIQYTNGQLYGFENNEVTKTPLCVMVKSISGKYRDVVSMTPITNINSDKLHVIWNNNMQVLTQIGFDVCVTMTDGHDSNVNFFNELRGGKNILKPIQNPFDSEKQVFLLFDPVHLFKNFYNNFLRKITFTYPAFQFIDSMILQQWKLASHI